MTNRIRIKLGQIEFEAEGEGDVISREREEFFKLLPQTVSLISKNNNSSDNQNTVIDIQDKLPPTITESYYESLAQLIREKGFDSFNDLILAAAYFLYKNQKFDSFNQAEIDTILSETHLDKPRNISDCINNNIKKGFIVGNKEKKDGQKSYYITNNGISYCESNDRVKNELSKTKSKKAKSQKQEKTTSLSNSISLEGLHLEKYCDITKLSDNRSKVYVLMYVFLIEQNTEYMSIMEIADILRKKMKISVTERQVKYVFEKSGILVDRKIDKQVAYYKLMTDGLTEAKKIISENMN